MIRPNFDSVLPSFKVVSECLKSPYNRKELQVVNFVIALGWLERLGIVRNRVPPVQCIRLFKNSTGSERAGVGYEPERLVVVREYQYGRSRESCDEGSKSSFLSVPPKKWGVFTCQFGQGVRDG
jgi:hypothetical protein